MNTGLAEFQTLSPSPRLQKDTPPPGSTESGTTVDVDEAPDSQNDANMQAGKQTPASASLEQGLPQRRGSFRVLVTDEDGNELKTSTALPEQSMATVAVRPKAVVASATMKFSKPVLLATRSGGSSPSGAA